MLPKLILKKLLLRILPIYPLLNLYNINKNEMLITQLLLPITAVLILSYLTYLGLSFLLKNKEKSTLITTVGFLTFFTYGPITRFFAGLFTKNYTSSYYTYLSLLTGIIILIAYVTFVVKIVRSKRSFFDINNAIAIGTGLLLISFISSVTAHHIFNRHSSDTTILHQTHPSSQAISTVPMPNVYHIILDGYGHSETLQKHYNFDNSEFESKLKKIGFWIPTKSHNNYSTTPLSITSTLDMSHLTHITERLPKGSTDQTLLRKMFNSAKGIQQFKSRGYRYYHIHSTVNFTKYNTLATKHLRTADSKVAQFEELNQIVTQETPLYHIIQLIRKTIGRTFWSSGFRQRNLNIFTQLHTVSEMEGPFIVFAHFLSPHPPYLFGPNGEDIEGTIDNNQLKGSIWNQKKEYIGQTIYLNKRLLSLVEDILSKKTSTPPIILIHSDHGPDSFGIEARMTNFIAMYNPYLNRPYPKSISNVNLYPLMIQSVFQDSSHFIENAIYNSSYEAPYNFKDISHLFSKDN